MEKISPLRDSCFRRSSAASGAVGGFDGEDQPLAGQLLQAVFGRLRREARSGGDSGRRLELQGHIQRQLGFLRREEPLQDAQLHAAFGWWKTGRQAVQMVPQSSIYIRHGVFLPEKRRADTSRFNDHFFLHASRFL